MLVSEYLTRSEYIYNVYGKMHSLNAANAVADLSKERFTGKEFDEELEANDLKIHILLDIAGFQPAPDCEPYLLLKFSDGSSETVEAGILGTTLAIYNKELLYRDEKTLTSLEVHAKGVSSDINYTSGNLNRTINEGKKLNIQIFGSSGVVTSCNVSEADAPELLCGGLYYFGARFLDPEIGMWISGDPMEQYWNSYSYCGGNPVNRIDIDGLWDDSNNDGYDDSGEDTDGGDAASNMSSGDWGGASNDFWDWAFNVVYALYNLYSATSTSYHTNSDGYTTSNSIHLVDPHDAFSNFASAMSNLQSPISSDATNVAINHGASQNTVTGSVVTGGYGIINGLAAESNTITTNGYEGSREGWSNDGGASNNGSPPPLKELYHEATAITIFEWVNNVREGGKWDFKVHFGPLYEPYGNFAYGVTGRAQGIPAAVLLQAAGAVQVLTGTSNPNWGQPWGSSPFGDDPRDQTNIFQGIQWADSQRSFYPNATFAPDVTRTR